ncbi:roadblock/LC7 domain-containing protein [candidate division WOR-3 bacterium]|nr:roadblock/LC7 domain-containing protein [candidate division WOR-3 bacterium]
MGRFLKLGENGNNERNISLPMERIRIYGERFERIKSNIDKLLQESDAKCAILIDKAGAPVAYSGDLSGIDIESFSALVAANFAATAEIASLVGEQDFETLYHQGETHNLYFQFVTKGIVLAVIFDRRTSLGLVRIKTENTAKAISSIIDEIFKQAESESSNVEVEPHREIPDITHDIEQDFDRLFGN